MSPAEKPEVVRAGDGPEAASALDLAADMASMFKGDFGSITE